jgi:hypothetical protein
MKWLAIVMTVAALAMVDPARAQLRGSTDAPPMFSAADQAVIARNKLLASIVEQEPRLVRRALDALAAVDDVQTRTDLRPGSPRADQGRPGRPSEKSDNPDLDRLERASPEAMNDLFQLLKQAGARRQKQSR